jgi:hypothetical protein
LGLDALIGCVVVVDYPGQRIALLEPGATPGWLLERTSWTNAGLRHGKLFLEVELAGERVTDLFFDTGSSALDIVMDLAGWTESTGCTGPDDAATVWTVNSWGSDVTVLGCPARGPLVVGTIRVDSPNVCCLLERPTLFSGWPFPTSGLVGSAPFWDDVVVIDLGVKPRFGVVR